MPRHVLTEAGPGRPKGSKNRETVFKAAWKAGLEKVVNEKGGPEAFIREWLANRVGKSDLNNHMLKLCHPTTEKVEITGKKVIRITSNVRVDDGDDTAS